MKLKADQNLIFFLPFRPSSHRLFLSLVVCISMNSHVGWENGFLSVKRQQASFLRFQGVTSSKYA